jgi:NAD(P)-dependent dehydrogenase (short-subunit alcohol dehydrogenase family)
MEEQMGMLDGQVALVTGGGRGLGRSIAHALAAQGAAVALDDLYKDENGVSAAETTAADIAATGAQSLALQEDVTTSKGAEAMVQAVIERFGRLDILITSAGCAASGTLLELDDDYWDFVVRLHLRGHFMSCKAAVPHMLARNSGRILTLGSRGAFFQVPANKQQPKASRKQSSLVYSTVKAGILGFSTNLAVELWNTGITVNCLLPSATTATFPETQPRMVGNVPPAQSLDPDDVAPTAVYLCTPQAANISGKLVYAAGGDIVIYGDQLDIRGARMLRKHGRWTVKELNDIVPSLIGVEAA